MLHLVSLAVGLSIAFGTALSMGAWQEEGRVAAQARPPSYAAGPSSVPNAPPPFTGASQSTAPQIMLMFVDSQEQALEADRRFARPPGWELHIVVVDEATAASREFLLVVDALVDARQTGQIKDFRVMDLRGQ
jgi:hypothetical protein